MQQHKTYLDSDLLVHRDGRVGQDHVQQGGSGKVLERSDTAIVIKWPAHTYTPGLRGLDRVYAPARTAVYRIIGGCTTDRFATERIPVEYIIEWENSRKR